MNDSVLELHSGSDVVLLARFDAVFDEDDETEECPQPALLRVLSMPDNLVVLRSRAAVIIGGECLQARLLSDDDLIERITAEVGIGRMKALRRPVQTFVFAGRAVEATTTQDRAPVELPRQRVTPSMRDRPKLPEAPKPPKLPDMPKIAKPDLPVLPDLAAGIPDVPATPKLPEMPSVAAVKDMAKTQAQEVAAMEELAKERAAAGEALEKARKAEEMARKVIELRNASKEEIAAFAMQLAAEYGEDIPPEYRAMLREYGNADKIKQAEKQAEKAADTASDVADKL